MLRAQLTLLYSGFFLGLLAAVLLATNLLYGHTAARAPENATPGVDQVGGTRQFDFGPAALGLAAAIVALAGAWWLAGRFLRPLRAITTTAQEISATDLSRRLDLDGPNDELTDLGKTLNDLFARLEVSFEAQRHFVANASHELRTPLAGQRTLLQVALADPEASTESLRATCEEALQLGDQQEHLIEALLTLATGEHGVEQWEPVDLDQITETVIAGRRQQAERRGITIDAALGRAPATGDPTLIERLVANLVDNALRHNTPGGQVEITTDLVRGEAWIAISNTGPAVPPAELKRLFQPFQQIGSQRVRHTDGHGLGLAIVRAIAQAHGATLTARPALEGGLHVEVTFH
ncbi:HAMP domain-containing sensor histidine kinase [Streptomyces sp. MK5]|uniref:sensor histidine kinase n=1 Tax=Streptomyces sp. MK5 TaxID=3064253 RepID=UPI00274203E3|nr:HAMP domain-containing sensor histidine kinase [Streptomyces sp. MK5]